MDNSVLSQQQVQLATSVFPLDNPASVIDPLSNPQNYGQLDTAKDIEVVSYPLQHAKSIKQSTGMLSLLNNHSGQSAPLPRSLKEQQQLTDQSCTTAQLHEDKDHNHNGVSSCCANNSDDWNGDFMDVELHKDGVGVNDEDVQEISNKDTTVNNNSESQEIKSINYTSTTIDTLDCENTELENLDGVSYKDSPAHVREKDHNLESISNAIVSHSCDHSAKISSEKSHLKMNTVIVDQEETENIMMIASNNSTILPKSYGGQMYVEDFVDLIDRVAKGEKDRWQLAGPLQSHDHPPEHINNGSGDLQIAQPYLASEHQSSSVCLYNGVFSQQQAQLAKSVFHVDNPASVIGPFSNPQGNGQLQIGEIGAVSNTLQHAYTIKQLIDESDNCLCAQLHEDYYADADVSSPIKVNTPPVSEQHSYTASASMGHNRYLSGLESGDCLAQALPVGSSTDGALLSAISQYKQTSAHIEHESKNQVGPSKNVLPMTHEASPPFPDTCDCNKNMASSVNSDVATGSPDSMQFTNFIQSNPGRAPDFTNCSSGGRGPDNTF